MKDVPGATPCFRPRPLAPKCGGSVRMGTLFGKQIDRRLSQCDYIRALTRPLPQLDRGLDYESRRHRFESYTAHHLAASRTRPEISERVLCYGYLVGTACRRCIAPALYGPCSQGLLHIPSVRPSPLCVRCLESGLCVRIASNWHKTSRLYDRGCVGASSFGRLITLRDSHVTTRAILPGILLTQARWHQAWLAVSARLAPPDRTT